MNLKQLRFQSRKGFKRNEKNIAVTLALVAMLTLTSGFSKTPIYSVQIHADGATVETRTTNLDTKTLLKQSGIALSAGDSVLIDKKGRNAKITVRRATPVTIYVDGHEHSIQTHRDTVGELLTEKGYHLDEYEISPGIDTKIEPSLEITLVNAEAARAAREAEEAARLAAIQEQEAARRTVNTSRGAARYSAVYTMEASAYLPSDGGGSGITASGLYARRGIVAVDPNVIPLGTRLYIPGYGEAIAGDTGGAIQGYSIDLCMESYGEAIQFGRRDIEVYVLQ